MSIPDRQEKILIIAPTLPRFDKSSGDLRLYSIIELLAREYDITFFTNHFQAGDELYAAQLRQWGVTVSGQEMSFGDLLENNSFTTAIIEFYFAAEYYLPRLRLLQPHCKVVIDSVDVHFLRERMKAETTGKSMDFVKAETTKVRELAIYSKADLVVTVTGDDAAVLEGECPGLLLGVVPNIHLLEPCTGDGCAGRTLIFVGNFNHDPNVDAVLFFVKDVLPLVWENTPDARLLIVGSNPTKDVMALACEQIEVTGFVPATTPYLHASAVSVAPLRYGAGMKGKIGEAMAHGLPVVTTSVGAQGMGLVHGKNVMIADAPDDFARSVLKLLNDKELYSTIKQNALSHIENNYTPAQVTESLKKLLRDLTSIAPKKMSLRDKGMFFYKYLLDKIKK